MSFWLKQTFHSCLQHETIQTLRKSEQSQTFFFIIYILSKAYSSGLDVWKMIGCHDDRFDLAPKSNYNYYFAWNWDLAPIYIIVFFADKCWYLGRRVEVLIGNLRYIFNIRALFFVLFCFFFYVICFRILQISKE